MVCFAVIVTGTAWKNLDTECPAKEFVLFIFFTKLNATIIFWVESCVIQLYVLERLF